MSDSKPFTPAELYTLARDLHRRALTQTSSRIEMVVQAEPVYQVVLCEKPRGGGSGMLLILGLDDAHLQSAFGKYFGDGTGGYSTNVQRFLDGLVPVAPEAQPHWDLIAPTPPEFSAQASLHPVTFQGCQQWLEAYDAASARTGSAEWSIDSVVPHAYIDVSTALFGVFHSYRGDDRQWQYHRLWMKCENPYTGEASLAKITAMTGDDGKWRELAAGTIDEVIPKWLKIFEKMPTRKTPVIGTSHRPPRRELSELILDAGMGGLFMDFGRYTPTVAIMQAAVSTAGVGCKWYMRGNDLSGGPGLPHVVCGIQQQMLGGQPGAELEFTPRLTLVKSPANDEVRDFPGVATLSNAALTDAAANILAGFHAACQKETEAFVRNLIPAAIIMNVSTDPKEPETD